VPNPANAARLKWNSPFVCIVRTIGCGIALVWLVATHAPGALQLLAWVIGIINIITVVVVLRRSH
jgi:hypothetical protein